MRLSVIFLTIFGLSMAKAQNFNIFCDFILSDMYTCQLLGVTISDNENANIIIGGEHQPGLGDINVARVIILWSNIPFIITQLFTSFPFLDTLYMMGSGLTRIQTNAFNRAHNLRVIEFIENPEFRAIHANGFLGATNLRWIDFHANQIDHIHEAAFSGLISLETLFLDVNQIHELPAKLFQPLIKLEWVVISDNQLETLDGSLFANNSNVERLSIARNRIDAIGRSFLDGMPKLLMFNTLENICANNVWFIDGVGVTLDTVRQGLTTCFDNSVDVEVPKDDVRKFTLELRGTLIIRDENGTEIIRI